MVEEIKEVKYLSCIMQKNGGATNGGKTYKRKDKNAGHETDMEPEEKTVRKRLQKKDENVQCISGQCSTMGSKYKGGIMRKDWME